MLLSGKVGQAQEADSIQAAQHVPNAAAYSPIYDVEVTLHPYDVSGSLSGDFKRAKQSQSLGEAGERWKVFLENHDAGENEDGFHANNVRQAKFELMRVLYLLGEVVQADKFVTALISDE